MKDEIELSEIADQVLGIVEGLDASMAVTALATATGQVVALWFDRPQDVLDDVIGTVCDTVADLTENEE